MRVFNRGRGVLFASLLAPVALYLGFSIEGERIDQRGGHFFETGKNVVTTVGRFARALQSKNDAELPKFFSPRFHGSQLGLTHQQLFEEKDGIRRYHLHSDGEAPSPDAALSEWKAYIDGFQSIEEIGMHLHRLEQWDSPDDPAGVIRMEVIGTPKGATQAGIDRAFFRMKFDGAESRLRIREASLVEGERVIADQPQFTDVTKTAGVEFMNRYYPLFLNQTLKFGMIRYGPGGITAVDYDNDGFYDLFIPDGVESKLFRNRGDGTFEDVTAKAGVSGLDGVSVAVFADYDNDGYKDLFVSHTFRHNQLFHNNGNGTFTDVTAKSGIGEDCCTTVASWGDYDNDGFLDLYVGRYLDPRDAIPTTFYARNGLPNQLYHNNGDGTFTNVTEKAGVGETGLCLGTVWGDYDGDGFLDLYVVNDFGRKTLYHNNRNGTFTDVTVKSGTLAYGAGMSASFADD